MSGRYLGDIVLLRFNGNVAKVVLASLVAAILVGISLRTVRAGSTVALVPAYFYPSGHGLDAWNQLAADARSAHIQAILNPASGPGAIPDPNYVAVVNRLRSAGGSVFGYVSTAYGNRDMAIVANEINLYIAMYNINGLFIDEMASSREKLSYYEKIYRIIKERNPAFEVVGNPGMPYTLESYLGTADTLVIFEGSSVAHADFKPLSAAAWVADYPACRFAQIVYAVDSEADLHRVLARAGRKNAGAVYVTDGRLPNPYGALPHYWIQEVNRFTSILRTTSAEVMTGPEDRTSKRDVREIRAVDLKGHIGRTGRGLVR